MTDSNQPTDWPQLVDTLSVRFAGMVEQVMGGLGYLLETGREVVHCAESALMVPADDSNLRFLISASSTPEVAAALKEILVPCDSSLAGYVYNTGQLIAVANPEDFYQGVDKKTGLRTELYFAAPVVDGEEVLGVVTFLNRPEGEPQDLFTPEELEAGQRLATLAAAALRYYNRLRIQEQMFIEEFHRAARRFDGPPDPYSEEVGIAAEMIESAPLAGVLSRWEQLSHRQQSLAAEMIDLLLRYGDNE